MYYIVCLVIFHSCSVVVSKTSAESVKWVTDYIGIPVYSDLAIAAYFAYFAKNAHIAYFPAYNGIFKILNIYLCISNIYLCINLQKFAYNRIFPHMRSHFSAFLRILSNVNTRTRIIYATYFRNATYMQHIYRIYAAYFSAYFAKFRIFFPHILHQNGPAYFKENFRYEPVSLTTRPAVCPAEYNLTQPVKSVSCCALFCLVLQ